MCWHTYRAPGQARCDYAECATRRAHLRIELALESEFGKRFSAPATRTLVLDGFGKLREARARLKVLVYRYHDVHASALRDLLQLLADDHPITTVPADSYLLIGAPWTEAVWRPDLREGLWRIVGRAGDSPWRGFDSTLAAFV